MMGIFSIPLDVVVIALIMLFFLKAVVGDH